MRFLSLPNQQQRTFRAQRQGPIYHIMMNTENISEKYQHTEVAIFHMTPTKFALEVEKYVKRTGSNYIDAVCYVCQLYDIDETVVPKYLSSTMRDKIEMDAYRLNLLKK